MTLGDDSRKKWLDTSRISRVAPLQLIGTWYHWNLTPFTPTHIKIGTLSWQATENCSHPNSGMVTCIQFKLCTRIDAQMAWHDMTKRSKGQRSRWQVHIIYISKMCLNSMPGGPINFVLGSWNCLTRRVSNGFFIAIFKRHELLRILVYTCVYCSNTIWVLRLLICCWNWFSHRKIFICQSSQLLK